MKQTNKQISHYTLWSTFQINLITSLQDALLLSRFLEYVTLYNVSKTHASFLSKDRSVVNVGKTIDPKVSNGPASHCKGTPRGHQTTLLRSHNASIQQDFISRWANRTKGSKCARTIDVTYSTGTQQQRPESPMIWAVSSKKQNKVDRP